MTDPTNPASETVDPSTQPPGPEPDPRKSWGRAILGVAWRVAAMAIFLVGVWFVGNYLLLRAAPGASAAQPTARPAVTPTMNMAMLTLPDMALHVEGGISRLALLHTTLPTRPRFDVSTYTVQSGDTIFGIAEKYGLKPQTIMWGNFEILGDDPDMIRPGLQLNILPENGAYHQWREGEGLNKVSEYYHVTPQAIIDWPGNHLTVESVGDFTHPSIAPGTMLFVPGGVREYISKVNQIPRASPAVGSYLGPGACSAVAGGLMGTGSFVWPVRGTITTQFSPDTNHPAIDIANVLGTPIAAADTGVVVYAGMTYDNIGYGNLVIIDHGNGWQTLYAHLNAIYVDCGTGVLQGATIGVVGSTGRSTGPHLHFQLASIDYGKVDPLGYLQ